MTDTSVSASAKATPADELNAMLRGYVDVATRLQQTHETLQHEVARLRSELAFKDQELERRRRLASLGELAAGVAHEVRNPLGAIALYSGLLRDKCQDLAPALALIDKIDSGIKAIDGVVQDTLALVPRGGQLASELLRTILERARDVCLNVLRTSQVELEIHYDDAEVTVPAHVDALQRVFVNLFANAAQAAPAESQIDVEVSAAVDGWVTVRVIDSGPGLSAANLDRVFDPFFTTKDQGTGLGLTIAHRLVEAHAGKLSARNRPPRGAEFVVALRTEPTNNQAATTGESAPHTTAA